MGLCHTRKLLAQTVKSLPAMWETRVQFLGWEDPLEKEMAIHCSTLAWKIPWMEHPWIFVSTEGCGFSPTGILRNDCILFILRFYPKGNYLISFLQSSLLVYRNIIFFVLIKIIIYLVSSFITYPTQIFPIFVSD